MNLSKRTSSNEDKITSRIELALAKDAKLELALSSNKAPENTSPNCPLKLHSFMVMASYETLWHKVMITPDAIIENKDYN